MDEIVNYATIPANQITKKQVDPEPLKKTKKRIFIKSILPELAEKNAIISSEIITSNSAPTKIIASKPALVTEIIPVPDVVIPPSSKDSLNSNQLTNYKCLLDVLNNRSFIGIRFLTEYELEIEKLILENTMAEYYEREIMIKDQIIKTILFMEIFSDQLENYFEKFVRQKIFHIMKDYLEHLTQTLILLKSKESYVKENSLCYLRIRLDEDFVRESKFLILIGTVIDYVKLNVTERNFPIGRNACVPTSSKIVLIYRVCPVMDKYLVKNAILRVYNDYTVIRKEILDFEYFIPDGYILYLENESGLEN